MPAKSRTGAPTTHSSARKMIISTSVVPRSRPIMTSRARIATPGISGSSRWRHSIWPLRARRESRSAPQITRASLAGSDGWIGQAADVDPALRAELRRPDEDRHDQADDRQRHQRISGQPEETLREPRADVHQRQAERDRQRLLEEPVERVAHHLQRLDRRGRQHHHQAERQQQGAAPEDQVVGGEGTAPAARARWRAGGPPTTAGPGSWPGSAPPPRWRRSPRFQDGAREGVSSRAVVGEHVRDAPAGASSTVSPGEASRAASVTTRSMTPSVFPADLHNGNIRRVSRERLGDPGPIGAQQHRAAQPLGGPRDQLVDVGALELPAGDPDDRRVGGQRGRRGVRVGGLGVVDVVDPLHGRHVGDPVGSGVKAASPSRTAPAGTPWARASAAAASALATLCGANGFTSASVASSTAERVRVVAEGAVDQQVLDDPELAWPGHLEGEADRRRRARRAGPPRGRRRCRSPRRHRRRCGPWRRRTPRRSRASRCGRARR